MALFVRKHETWLKTGTYALMHLTVAVAIAYMLTHSWVMALSIGLLEPAVQTFCFHFHERGWKRLTSNEIPQTIPVDV